MEESWFPAGQWTGQKAGSRTTPDPPLDAITADDSEGPDEAAAAAAAEKQADGVTIEFLMVTNLDTGAWTPKPYMYNLHFLQKNDP